MPQRFDQHVPVLLSAEEIGRRVGELARQLATDYAGRRPLLIGVLKGSWIFLADLVRQMEIPLECDFVSLSSYGAGTTSSGQITVRLNVHSPLAGRDVLIVEDIVDTGLSTSWLISHLQKQQPASVRLCVLLDKPSRRQVPVHIDYLGFTIPDRFVVGYGIDHAEQYRELPYVGYLEK